MKFFAIILLGFALAGTEADISSYSPNNFNQVSSNSQPEQANPIIERQGSM